MKAREQVHTDIHLRIPGRSVNSHCDSRAAVHNDMHVRTAQVAQWAEHS